MKRIVVVGLLFSLIFFFGCNKKYEHEIRAKALVKQNVEILPGIGIIVNKDTVYLEKTTVKKLGHMFKIDTVSSPCGVYWDGVAWSGERAGGFMYQAEYSYGNIRFRFSDEKSIKKIALRQISIGGINKYNVCLYKHSLNQSDKSIRAFFSQIKADFLIGHDSTYYVLSNYGIGLCLAKKNNFSSIVSADIFMPKKSVRP